jgi:hypothetical protein
VAPDVDYYSSARAALWVLEDPDPLEYLPLTTVYLDDVAFEGHKPWCGELLAVAEFIATHERRKIGKFNFLRQTRIFKIPAWIDHMYALHLLDHPYRTPGDRRGAGSCSRILFLTNRIFPWTMT